MVSGGERRRWDPERTGFAGGSARGSEVSPDNEAGTVNPERSAGMNMNRTFGGGFGAGFGRSKTTENDRDRQNFRKKAAATTSGWNPGRSSGFGTGGGRRGVEIRARHIMCRNYADLADAYAATLHKYGDTPPVREFARTAREISECESARRGGDLGWQITGRMNAMKLAIQSPLMSLQPGQMSHPFRMGGTENTPATYHVVYLEDRRSRRG